MGTYIADVVVAHPTGGALSRYLDKTELLVATRCVVGCVCMFVCVRVYVRVCVCQRVRACLCVCVRAYVSFICSGFSFRVVCARLCCVPLFDHVTGVMTLWCASPQGRACER